MGANPWTEDAFRNHERYVWGLAYRMTGSTADADDVVQETFARAIERPPARLDAPLRPWLTCVAVNVARDALRRRKRRPYVGPWLPSPAETSALEGFDPEWARADPGGAEARYDLRESASYAFLLALEALTPKERAVLVLRDVLDHSVRETAEALAITDGNVKTTLHRARGAMETYDRSRQIPTRRLADETRAVLQRFLLALASGDTAGILACLSERVRAISDGGGEYLAALRPIVGRDRVARFLLGLQRKKAQVLTQVVLTELNGLPAMVLDVKAEGTRWAPRFVLRCELDASGAIREVHILAASKKLLRVSSHGSRAPGDTERQRGLSGRP